MSEDIEDVLRRESFGTEPLPTRIASQEEIDELFATVRGAEWEISGLEQKA